MTVNVSGNILSSTGFTSSGEITNTPNVVTDGLVLWYDAGNNASYINSTNYYDCGYGCQYYASNPGCTNCNTQIKDMSGNGHDGTLNTATILYNNTGGLMNFNGSTDYVTIGTNSAYSSLTNITLDFWCYPTRSANYEYLISNSRDCCGSYNGYNLVFSNSVPGFAIWNGTADGAFASSPITLNNYYHIVGTYDGSVINLYVNGVLSRTTNSTLGIGTPATYTTYIGGMGYSPTLSYQGYIGSSRIYNRALSYAEVVQNFNDGRQRFGI